MRSFAVLFVVLLLAVAVLAIWLIVALAGVDPGAWV